METLLYPSLPLLIFKTLFLLFVTGLTGWSIFPQRIYPRHLAVSWVAWQALGTVALLVCGFTLTRIDIPGKWLFVIVGLLFVIRAGNWIQPRGLKKGLKEALSSALPRESDKGSLLAYITVLACVSGLYYLPFILRNTSGFYAYGGGDQSSYLRISDLLLEQTLGDITRQWQSESSDGNFPVSFLAPSPSYSARQLVYYIRRGMSWTYATQTIGMPFMALAPGFTEESFTVGVLIYLLILCWGAAILVGSLTESTPPFRTLATCACVVAVGSPALSLALKHAIPALFAWGMTLFLLGLLFSSVRGEVPRLPTTLFAFGTTACVLMYLPALTLTSPLWLLGLVLLGWGHGKGALRQFLGVLLLVVLLGNVELLRPLKLLSSNMTRQLVDYGLQWRHLPSTLLGVADFETLLSFPRSDGLLTLVASGGVFIGLLLGLGRLDGRGKLGFMLLVPAMIAVPYYMLKGGHYHVIRVTEFVAVPVLALAALGWDHSIGRGRSKRSAGGVALAGMSLAAFLLGSCYYKLYIFASLASNDNQFRASMAGRASLVLAREIVSLQREARGDGQPATVFAMTFGAIQCANNEIIFRDVPYLEAFEYDYQASFGLDLLSDKYLGNALLVFPGTRPADILDVSAALRSEPHWQRPGYAVWHTMSGRGAALIGTGWLAPRLESGITVRYLRDSQEGGVVIWSDRPQAIVISLIAFYSPNPPGGAMLCLRYGEDREDESLQSPSELENGKPVPAGSQSHLAAKELRFTVAPWGTHNPAESRLRMHLRPGANLIRLFPRTLVGARGGFNFSTGKPYEQTGKIPWLLVQKIRINTMSDESPSSLPALGEVWK